jgi:hypothetical protein
MFLYSTVSTLKPWIESLENTQWKTVTGPTDGWDRGDDLAQFEFIQDGRLSGSVKADHENAWK